MAIKQEHGSIHLNAKRKEKIDKEKENLMGIYEKEKFSRKGNKLKAKKIQNW